MVFKKSSKRKILLIVFILLAVFFSRGKNYLASEEILPVDEFQFVEGFSSMVSYAYTWDYPSYRGAMKSWGEYAIPPAWDKNPPSQQIIWNTGICPEKKDTIFIFTGSTGEDPGGIALYLNNEYILTFESNINKDTIWRGNECQLFFKSKGYVVGNNGIYYLIVPKNRITAGRDCQIKTTHVDGREKSWFMIMGYIDVLDYEGIYSHQIMVNKFMKGELHEKKDGQSADKKIPKLSSFPAVTLLMNFKEGKGKITEDISASNNSGKIHGTEWVQEGLRFDGDKDYIEITNTDNLAITRQITIEAGIKIPQEKGKSERVIVSKDGAFSFSLFYGQLEGSVWINGQKIGVFSGYKPRLNDGVWHHVGMVYDGYLLKLIADGEFYGSKVVSGEIDNSSSNLFISSPKSSFEGIISTVRISNNAIEMLPVADKIAAAQKEMPVMEILGEPFFPIGLYTAVQEDSNLVRLKKIGFNLVGPREHFQIYEDEKLEKTKEFLDKVYESGLKAWLGFWYKVDSPVLALRAGTILTEERDEKIKYIKRFVSAFKNHPALLMWDIGDELSQDSTLPIERIVEAYGIIKELDSIHPIWTNHPCWEVPKEFSVIADVHSGDLYPFYDTKEADISMIGRYVDDLCELVNYKKPVWMVLQADHVQGGRFSTLKELRFMTYSAIVHGAKGVLYFGQDLSVGWTSEFWETMGNIAKELDFMSPILVGRTYKGKIKLAFEPQKAGIKGICKDYNGEKYLIVINEEPAPIKVTFTFSSLTDISDIEVLFEGRTIKSTGKTFADLFQGYEVHIYKIEGGIKK